MQPPARAPRPWSPPAAPWVGGAGGGAGEQGVATRGAREPSPCPRARRRGCRRLPPVPCACRRGSRAARRRRCAARLRRPRGRTRCARRPGYHARRAVGIAGQRVEDVLRAARDRGRFASWGAAALGVVARSGRSRGRSPPRRATTMRWPARPPLVICTGAAAADRRDEDSRGCSPLLGSAVNAMREPSRIMRALRCPRRCRSLPSLVGSPPHVDYRARAPRPRCPRRLNAIFLPSGGQSRSRTPCTLAVFVSV